MKKLIYLFILAIGFTSCSVESMDSTENLIVADAKAKVTVAESFNVPQEICEGVPAQFSFTAAVGTNLQVQQWVGGVWVQVYQTSQSTANPQTFNLSFAQAGSYSLRYKIGSGGYTNAEPVIVLPCTDCEESFSYNDNGDDTYTFTYKAGEDMDDAELTMTFPQVNVEAPEGWHNNAKGNSSAWKNSMNLEACSTYNWTFTLTSDCNGLGQDDANLWTDFKVGEDSKKNKYTPNIVKSC